MLTQEPTPEMYAEWKFVWKQYKDKLKPNRKSGQELLGYLSGKYALTEIHEKKAMNAITFNVTMNKPLAEKLPNGAVPLPRAFFLENVGNGAVFYKSENRDPVEVFGEEIPRIFIGIDLASGYFMVEGSRMLWDELYAFQGIDESDIENPYCVAQYIACLKRFNRLEDVIDE